MGVWLGPMGTTTNFIEQNDINYSISDFIYTSNGKNWEIALTSSGTLSFAKNPGKVDIFIVAGGQTAPRYDGERNAYSGPAIGDPGGNGGECITVETKLLKEQNYSIVIGGSDQNSSFSTGMNIYMARSGYGSAGGAGGQANSSTQESADAGIDGVFAYNKNTDTLLFTEQQFEGHKFGAGGGGGGARYKNTRWGQGAAGGESNGGETLAYGHGGTVYQYEQYPNGKQGYSNHGQGGGGAAYYWQNTGGGAPRFGDQGAGGSGIIFIRNHRSS